MPFQMPEIQNNIGNALANIGQMRQQRTQNALADRQLGLSEAAGRRQDEQFRAEQATAQRARVEGQMKAIAGALYRQDEASRPQYLEALRRDPRFADMPAMAWDVITPEALKTGNLALFLNAGGELTPEQKAEDARRNAEATTAGDQIYVMGTDGKPRLRYVSKFDLTTQYDPSADPNSILTNGTSRANNAATNATSRANNEATNRQSDINSRRSATTSAATSARAGPSAAEMARQGKVRSASTAATYYGQARDAFDTLRDTLQAGGPIQTLFGSARAAIHPNERMAAAKFDSAIRALTPVLKNLIRGPGEGTWSDGDQAVLESILPNRSMNEMQIAESLRNLETLLRDNGANIPQSRTPGTTPGASGGWGEATVVED